MKNGLRWKFWVSGVTKQWFLTRGMIYGTTFSFSLNSQRYPLKNIPEPFFCKIQGYACYRAPNMKKKIIPGVLATWGEYLRSAWTHDEKKLYPQEGPNVLSISYRKDFSQSKNHSTYGALSRQKRLTHISKNLPKPGFSRFTRNEKM